MIAIDDRVHRLTISHRRAESLARFAAELSRLIDATAGTPERNAPWVAWARGQERVLNAEVRRLRGGRV
jgi:hypothetical protein